MYPDRKESELKLIFRGKTLKPYRMLKEEGLRDNSLVVFLEVIDKSTEEDAKYRQPEFEDVIHLF